MKILNSEKARDVGMLWVCPDCGAKTDWSLLDAALGGDPVCYDCDCDMDVDLSPGIAELVE